MAPVCVPCSGPSLVTVGRRSISTRVRTLACSWALTWQRLWAASHVYIFIWGEEERRKNLDDRVY